MVVGLGGLCGVHVSLDEVAFVMQAEMLEGGRSGEWVLGGPALSRERGPPSTWLQGLAPGREHDEGPVVHHIER